jgi:hypothetical protein
MDQRQALMRRFTGLLLTCTAVGTAGAHPHEDIDQQVLLSVGTGEVTVQVRIAPSFIDGAAIFAHIDTNGDGEVSDAEAKAFGSDVIARAALRVDGQVFEFNAPRVSVPALKWVSAGFGVIEVDATAAVKLMAVARHRVDFEISYGDLAHEWFIQPFYYRDLVSKLSSQSFERLSSGNRVVISLAP